MQSKQLLVDQAAEAAMRKYERAITPVTPPVVDYYSTTCRRLVTQIERISHYIDAFYKSVGSRHLP